MSETFVHNGTCLKECSAFETYCTVSLAPFLQFITPFKQDKIQIVYGYNFFSFLFAFSRILFIGCLY